MRSPLSETFYSKANLEYLQKTIIESVKKDTGYTIGRQNDMDLYNLMRKIYTDYVVSDASDIAPQVSKMNSVVVSEATRTIKSALIADLMYLRDISTNPVPPEIPKSTSLYGLRLSRRI